MCSWRALKVMKGTICPCGKGLPRLASSREELSLLQLDLEAPKDARRFGASPNSLQAVKDWGAPILDHLELVEDWGVNSCRVGGASPKMGFRVLTWRPLMSVSRLGVY